MRGNNHHHHRGDARRSAAVSSLSPPNGGGPVAFAMAGLVVIAATVLIAQVGLQRHVSRHPSVVRTHAPEVIVAIAVPSTASAGPPAQQPIDRHERSHRSAVTGDRRPWYAELLSWSPTEVSDVAGVCTEGQPTDSGGRGYRVVPGHAVVEQVLQSREWQLAEPVFSLVEGPPSPRDVVVKRSTKKAAPTSVAASACSTNQKLPDVRSLPKVWHTHKVAKPREHTPTDLLMRLVFDNVDNADVFVAGGTLQTAPDIAHQNLCRGGKLPQQQQQQQRRGARSLQQADSIDDEDVTAAAGRDEPDDTPPSGKAYHLSLRNTQLDGAAAPDVVLRTEGAAHPTHAVSFFAPPVSFANDPRLRTGDAQPPDGDGADDDGDGASSKGRHTKKMKKTKKDAVRFRMDRPFGEWKTAFQLPVGSPNRGSDRGAPAVGGSAAAQEGTAFALDIEKATYPQVARPAPPQFYAVFPAGSFVTDGNVVTCNKAYTTGGCMWDFKLFGSASPGHALPATHQHGTIVALCDYWCKGYFHFTHEHLPRLALVDHILRADKGAKVTVPRSTGFVRQYLIDVLGYDESQLISVSSTYQATAKAVYPQPQRCGSIFTPTLLMLRRLVFERLGGLPHTICDPFPRATPAAAVAEGDAASTKHFLAAEIATTLPLVVWAERKKLSRMPKNYYAIRTEIEARYAGRAVFRDTSGLGIREQIELFNRAAVIIGPHGANLANVMWARHGAYVVEFMSHRYANMCYYGTAARLGVRFGAVFHGALKHGAYNSSTDEVALHVDEGLKAYAPEQGGLCR